MKKFFFSAGRRRFLKASAASTAGLALEGLVIGANAGQASNMAVCAWTPGMQINPAIDNLRCVVAHDPEMNDEIPLNWSAAAQHNAAHYDRISENMDKMAVALAQKPTAAEAWGTIFQLPEGKTWPEVTAAIKVNCVMDQNCPRGAILEKVCHALNGMGVPYGNITVYDAGAPSAGILSRFYDDSDLPSMGVQIVPVPGGSGTTQLTTGENVMCPNDFKDGAIDILINIPVNKGHQRPPSGGYTLTMKNHIGTLRGAHGPEDQIPELLVAINQSEEILGSGNVPRQQLNIVDALWSTVAGPNGTPSHVTNRLVMGTCSPIVDYLTVKHIREAIMDVSSSSYPTNWDSLNQYLSAYGYDPESSEIQNLELVDALTYDPGETGNNKSEKGYPTGKKTAFVLSVAGSHFRASFLLPEAFTPERLDIVSIRGAVMISLKVASDTSGTYSLEWDGRNLSGARVPAGRYAAKLSSGNRVMSRPLVIR